MATPNPNIIYRSGSAGPLTFAQLDGNFALLSQSIADMSTPESASYATTASYVEIAQTASYFDGTVENATTASYVDAANVDGTVTSASYALTASYALSGGSGGNIDTSSLATTGSNTFTANQTIVGNVTFPSSSFISTSNTSGSLFLSALNEGTLFLNNDGGEGDVVVGYNGWTHKMDVRGPIQVTNIQGTGSLYLKPDEGDVAERQFEIYNTAPSDIHFKGSATHSFFGDDTNYLKIDDSAATVTIDSTNGLFINSNTTISGDAEFSGSILVSGSIIPNTDGVSSTSSFDLGSPTAAWKDIYVSNGTINFLNSAGTIVQTMGTGNNQLEGDTTMNGPATINGDLSIYSSGPYSGSFTHGSTNTATGVESHAAGANSVASGDWSHAEGGDGTNSQEASGKGSHVEGIGTVALGWGSHAEGRSTRAEGSGSHAEGWFTYAKGIGSHAEGRNTSASGDYSHAEGSFTSASGRFSHAEGSSSIASGTGSHAEGLGTIAAADYQHVAGRYNRTSSNSDTLFIIGNGSANNNRSNVLLVDIYGSTVDGNSIVSGSLFVNAPGQLNQVVQGTGHGNLGQFTFDSHIEGRNNDLGSDSHYSHVEGVGNVVNGQGCHGEGENTFIDLYAVGSHAEGFQTKIARGTNHAHAEGSGTIATGSYSHAEGIGTITIGTGSHAEGLETIAKGNFQHVTGQYNATSSVDSAFIVGNGYDGDNRSNLIFAAEETVSINNLVKLTVRSTNPPAPQEGMIMASGSAGSSVLYYYNGTSWNALF
jgi:hypothetical protein